MKIDVTKELVGFDGKPVQERDEDAVAKMQADLVAQRITQEQFREANSNGAFMRTMTLRLACTTALMAGSKDNNPDGAEKLRRFMLARKIHEEDEPSISVEDVSLLKKLVGAMFIPNVVGPVWNLLEGESEQE